MTRKTLMQANIYKVQISSNLPECNGTFNLDVRFAEGSRHVVGGPFGCSRDYFVASDQAAIRSFLLENCAKMGSCEEVKCVSY